MAYNHKEAFCLMRYATKDEMEIETLWNSRDGVTPFIILSRTGREMQHVNWTADRCEPGYKPFVGQRVFVDSTPELLRPKCVDYVDKYWDMQCGDRTMREAYAPLNKSDVVDMLLKDWCKEGSPTVVEWSDRPKAVIS